MRRSTDRSKRTLLDEFLIPYGILDCDGRVIWMNQTLCHMVGKDKRYRKNIQTLFPEIHQGTLPVPKEVKEVEIHYGKKDYCARLQRVNVEGLAESVDMIEIPEGRNYLIAIYLFDDTELKRYIQENQDQKLVPGLIYLTTMTKPLRASRKCAVPFWWR